MSAEGRRGTTEDKVKACRERLAAVRKKFAEDTANAAPNDRLTTIHRLDYKFFMSPTEI